MVLDYSGHSGGQHTKLLSALDAETTVIKGAK